MIVFVDYEHASRYEQEGTDWLLAARARITYRLEDLAGVHCMLVRYDRIDRALVARLGAQAVFISGQGTDPSRYDPADLAGLTDVVCDGGLPVFGFCGGWQFMATAMGEALVPIDVPPERRDDPIMTTWGDRDAEFGYHPVDIEADHPLLDGIADDPIFRHAHALHIPDLPAGFRTLASTPVTPVQLAVDDERKMVGTQFHPEYWTDEHPAGRRMIENFLTWSGVGA